MEPAQERGHVGCNQKYSRGGSFGTHIMLQSALGAGLKLQDILSATLVFSLALVRFLYIPLFLYFGM